MSYSSLVTYKNLTSKKSNRRSTIDTIIPHCYVGQVTAKEGCDYLASTNREVSANYVVGKDGSIGLNVDEDYRAWTSGGTDKNGNPIRVNGISGADWDHRAVTIEVASDTKPPYAVTDKAYKALIELIADICKRNNIKELKWEGNKSLVGKIDKQNMAVHRWFAPTECPGDYLYSKMGDIAKKVNDIIVEKPVTKPVETPTKSNVIHRVQVGAFKQEPNAKNYLAKVKNAGFKDAFITKVGDYFKVQVGAFSSKTNAENFLKTVKKAGFDAILVTYNDSKVTETTVKTDIEEGDTVKVKKGAKTYEGGSLASFVYDRKHIASEIEGDRVVITYKGVVVGAVKKSDLTLA